MVMFPQSHKAKLMRHPSGILQLTPESLEAILLHKHMAVPRLFGDLRFVVIDEVHSLLRGDRGGQTLCLIERVSRLAGVNPRRIGLSATMGDPERTGAFVPRHGAAHHHSPYTVKRKPLASFPLSILCQGYPGRGRADRYQSPARSR